MFVVEKSFNKKVKDNRNIIIDILKGIAIILVVWGHVIQYYSGGKIDFFENFVFRFIYSFHMPLFMVISGYLFQHSCRRSVKEIIKKQISGTTTPILWGGTACWLFNRVLDLKNGVQLTYVEMLKTWIEQIKGIWFLWCLLICSLAVGIVYKQMKRLRDRIVLWCVVWFLMLLVPGVIQPAKSFNFWLFPFFLGGFMFHEYQRKISPELLKFRYASFLVFPVMLSFFHRKHYIYISGVNPFTSEYGMCTQIYINIFRWGLGIVGVIFCITIVTSLVKIKTVGKIGRIIANMGENTLQIYIMQLVLLETISNHLVTRLTSIGVFFLHNNVVYSLVFTPLIAIIYLSCFNWLSNYLKCNMPRLSYIVFRR